MSSFIVSLGEFKFDDTYHSLISNRSGVLTHLITNIYHSEGAKINLTQTLRGRYGGGVRTRIYLLYLINIFMPPRDAYMSTISNVGVVCNYNDP